MRRAKRWRTRGRTWILWLSTLALAPAAPAEEVLDHAIDRRADGKETAGTVLVSFRESGGAGQPHAVFVASRNEAGATVPVAGFGVWSDGGEVVAGAVDAERLAQLRASPAGRLEVTVDEAKLAATVEALSELASAESSDLGPAAVWDNLVFRLIPILELDAPYRGGFGPGDPYVLARDLTRLNRPR